MTRFLIFLIFPLLGNFPCTVNVKKPGNRTSQSVAQEATAVRFAAESPCGAIFDLFLAPRTFYSAWTASYSIDAQRLKNAQMTDAVLESRGLH